MTLRSLSVCQKHREKCHLIFLFSGWRRLSRGESWAAPTATQTSCSSFSVSLHAVKKSALCLHFKSQCGDISKSGEGSTTHNKSSPSCRGEEVDLPPTTASLSRASVDASHNKLSAAAAQNYQSDQRKSTLNYLTHYDGFLSVWCVSLQHCWVLLIKYAKLYQGLFRHGEHITAGFI